MKTVKEVLQDKGYAIWSVAPDTTVYDALKLMAEKDIGAVLALNPNGSLAGILSERDCARRVNLEGKSPKSTFVQDIMTKNVVSVRADQTLEDCMELMSRLHLRHLPVLENSRLVGIISTLDVVRALISEKERTIKQLEDYITGRR